MPAPAGLARGPRGARGTGARGGGEGELLRRVRDVGGADGPISVSLDLHSNTTEAMVRHADTMVAYRTYPHVDMAHTGRAAYALLDRMLRTGARRRRPSGLIQRRFRQRAAPR